MIFRYVGPLRYVHAGEALLSSVGVGSTLGSALHDLEGRDPVSELGPMWIELLV